MTIIKDTRADKPMQEVRCRLSELNTVTGGYRFKSGAKLGDHSAVIVTDSPGLLLFYDASANVLKEW